MLHNKYYSINLFQRRHTPLVAKLRNYYVSNAYFSLI